MNCIGSRLRRRRCIIKIQMTPIFFFSLAALAVYVAGGIYFLYLWFSTGRKHMFLLFWGYALATIFLVKTPGIIANTGIGVVQEDLYPFLYIGQLLRFLAYSAFMFGLSIYTGFSWRKSSPILCLIWFFSAVVYFFFSFFYDGIKLTYMPIWAGNFLFYIPAQICLMSWLKKIWEHTSSARRHIRGGVVLLFVGTLVLTTTCLLGVYTQTQAVLPQFWYHAGISSPWIPFLQIISGALLFFGLYLLTRSRLQTT